MGPTSTPACPTSVSPQVCLQRRVREVQALPHHHPHSHLLHLPLPPQLQVGVQWGVGADPLDPLQAPASTLCTPPCRVTDAAFNFLLVWYYCTLTIRESILINNGSRWVRVGPSPGLEGAERPWSCPGKWGAGGCHGPLRSRVGSGSFPLQPHFLPLKP